MQVSRQWCIRGNTIWRMRTGIYFWCHTSSPIKIQHLLSPIWDSYASFYSPNRYQGFFSRSAMIQSVTCSSWFQHFFLIQSIVCFYFVNEFVLLKITFFKKNDLVWQQISELNFLLVWMSHVVSETVVFSAPTSDLTFHNCMYCNADFKVIIFHSALSIFYILPTSVVWIVLCIFPIYF